ncbi:hypothetical protein B0T17DRAFT_313896 [Bombardia bombarda]|uniref:Uncharacterized protein n=1 Tax=Bombardia bombarda TaxID=252184 RepID=A0AA39WLZ7_9PEZI|nr:hypothetical protein B0T17DRAFT_313896 [Bombardia bombarda]
MRDAREVGTYARPRSKKEQLLVDHRLAEIKSPTEDGAEARRRQHGGHHEQIQRHGTIVMHRPKRCTPTPKMGSLFSRWCRQGHCSYCVIERCTHTSLAVFAQYVKPF